MGPGGGYVAVWQDDSNENEIFEVKGKGLPQEGAGGFSDRHINSESDGHQLKPAIAVRSVAPGSDQPTGYIVWQPAWSWAAIIGAILGGLAIF